MFQIEQFIENQNTETAGILSQLRRIILQSHPKMVETWKYNVPFYVCKGMFCYLSVEKKTNLVYVGFCDGHLMPNEMKYLSHEDKKIIRRFYVDKHLDESNSEIFMTLLQEALLIKDTLRPKFTPIRK